MQRISSRNTFFVKRITPLLSFGGLVLFLALPFVSGRPPLAWLLVSVGTLIFVGIVGRFILKRLILDLADEVFDDGDALLVRKHNREERIPFSDIANVRCNIFCRPNVVTLTLRKPSAFGQEIAFLRPPFVPLVKAQSFQNLIERIEARRDLN